MEEQEPVQTVAYKSESLENVSVSQHLMMEGQGPRTKKPGGGLPETRGELLIDDNRRLDSSPKLFVRGGRPIDEPRPSDRCERDLSDIGWLPKPLPVLAGSSMDWRGVDP